MEYVSVSNAVLSLRTIEINCGISTPKVVNPHAHTLSFENLYDGVKEIEQYRSTAAHVISKI